MYHILKRDTYLRSRITSLSEPLMTRAMTSPDDLPHISFYHAKADPQYTVTICPRSRGERSLTPNAVVRLPL